MLFYAWTACVLEPAIEIPTYLPVVYYICTYIQITGGLRRRKGARWQWWWGWIRRCTHTNIIRIHVYINIYNGTKEEPPAAHRCRVTLIIFYICISGLKWRPEKPPRNNGGGGGNDRIHTGRCSAGEHCTAAPSRTGRFVSACVYVNAGFFVIRRARGVTGERVAIIVAKKGAETDPSRTLYIQ